MCLSGPEKMILKVRLMRGAARWRFIIPVFGNNLLFFFFYLLLLMFICSVGLKGYTGKSKVRQMRAWSFRPILSNISTSPGLSYNGLLVVREWVWRGEENGLSRSMKWWHRLIFLLLFRCFMYNFMPQVPVSPHHEWKHTITSKKRN